MLAATEASQATTQAEMDLAAARAAVASLGDDTDPRVDPEDALEAFSQLGDVLLDQGRVDAEAEHALSRALFHLASLDPAGLGPDTANLRQQLARVVLAQGDAERAAALAAQASAAIATLLADATLVAATDEQTLAQVQQIGLQADVVWAQALTRLQRWSEAETLLQAALARLRTQPNGESSADYADLLTHLGLLFEQQGRAAQADASFAAAGKLLMNDPRAAQVALTDAALTDAAPAKRQDAAARLAICALCPEQIHTLNARRCRACGCFLRLKTLAPWERCPQGRW